MCSSQARASSVNKCPSKATGHKPRSDGTETAVPVVSVTYSLFSRSDSDSKDFGGVEGGK